YRPRRQVAQGAVQGVRPAVEDAVACYFLAEIPIRGTGGRIRLQRGARVMCAGHDGGILDPAVQKGRIQIFVRARGRGQCGAENGGRGGGEGGGLFPAPRRWAPPRWGGRGVGGGRPRPASATTRNSYQRRFSIGAARRNSRAPSVRPAPSAVTQSVGPPAITCPWRESPSAAGRRRRRRGAHVPEARLELADD